MYPFIRRIRMEYLLTPMCLGHFNYQFEQARASLVAQSVKNLPAMQETWVRFLGWEDHLEKEMATHFNILASKISWTEEPGELQSMGCKESGTTED